MTRKEMATQETNDANLDTKSGGANVGTVLLALADRCEREEPGQDLDECIWSNIAGDDFAYETTPHYTTSLDAAVTLVPEGWEWSYSNRPNRGRTVHIELWHNASASSFPSAYSEKAKTFALALCAAALRARAYLAELHAEATP